MLFGTKLRAFDFKSLVPCPVASESTNVFPQPSGGFPQKIRLQNLRRIGIDLDNTLACYDGVFGREARRMDLLPAGVREPSKIEVRTWLQGQGRNDLWTELQGWVYGPAMVRATVFPGALEFVRRALDSGHQIWILSHRTRKPAMGPEHDLWGSALGWLDQKNFFRPTGPLGRRQVFLVPSREEKIRLMIRLGCTDFIDDLPEVFLNPLFPCSIQPHLFDPRREHGRGPWRAADTWFSLRERILRP